MSQFNYSTFFPDCQEVGKKIPAGEGGDSGCIYCFLPLSAKERPETFSFGTFELSDFGEYFIKLYSAAVQYVYLNGIGLLICL